MKQTIKRLTALILAIAMSLSLLSANVWATEEPEDSSISAQSSEDDSLEETASEPEEESSGPSISEGGAVFDGETSSEQEEASEPEEESVAPEDDLPTEQEAPKFEEQSEPEEEQPLEDESIEQEAVSEDMSEDGQEDSQDKDKKKQTLEPMESDSPDLENAINLTVNTVYPVVLTSESLFKTFSFTPNQDDIYVFSSSGNDDCDPYGSLFDESGDRIDYNDDGNENSNFRIKHGLEKGKKYYYVAKCYRNSTGSYSVQLTTLQNSGSCGEDVTWNFDRATGTMTIAGTGRMNSNDYKDDFEDEIKKAVIEDGVTYIASYAFSYCDNLEEAVISDSVTEIGDNAFYECTKLTTVTISDPLPELGEEVFDNVPWWNQYKADQFAKIMKDAMPMALDTEYTVHITDETPSASFVFTAEQDGDYAFFSSEIGEVNPKGSIYNQYGLCMETSEKYWDPTNYKLREEFEAGKKYYFVAESNDGSTGTYKVELRKYAKNKAGRNLTWSYSESNKTLTIQGSGKMDDYEYESYSDIKTTSPWTNYYDKIEQIKIESGATSIGNYAFYHMPNLKKVEIPASVTDIGDWAFSFCKQLSDVTISTPWPDLSFNAFVETPWWKDNAPVSGSCGENLTWSFAKNTGVLTISGSGAMPDYDMWDNDEGAGITAPWYDPHADSIKKVVVKSGVTRIGDCAFAWCSNLSSVVLPDSVNEVGDCAFQSDKNLTSVNIPNGVTIINSSTFAYCEKLTSIIIPATVTQIGWGAFEECTMLADIQFLGSMPSYSSNAFSGTAWWNEHSPKSGSVGANATWTYDSGSRTLTISGSGAMTDYYYLNSIPWYDNKTNIRSIVISDGITKIGANVFEDCTGVTSVSIPDSVTEIAYGAFENCDGLTSLPDLKNVKILRGRVFSRCDGLTSVTIPATVLRVEEDAVSYCYNLGSVTIVSSETIVEESAFAWCKSLEEVHIPKTSNKIDKDAFYGTPWVPTFGTCGDSVQWVLDLDTGILTVSGSGDMEDCDYEKPWAAYSNEISSIVVENGITSIGDHCFSGLDFLSDVSVPNSVTSIGEYAFCGCGSLATVTIPDSVTRIRDGAFNNCESLATVQMDTPWPKGAASAFDGTPWFENVSIITGKKGTVNWTYDRSTETLTVAGSGEMDTWRDYPNSARNVIINEGITSVGWRAFEEFRNLTSVVIPSTVTKVEYSAFRNCDALTDVTMPSPWPEFGAYAFLHTPWLAENAPTSGDCGSNLKWSYQKGSKTLTITGTGAMSSFDNPWNEYPDNEAPWQEAFGDEIETVVIEEGVTSIGEWAFEGCESIKSVTLPSSLTRINEGAFWDCDALEEITIPASVTYISTENDAGDGAFTGLSLIRGYSGSAAETYASNSKIPFISLDAPVHAHPLTKVDGSPATCTQDGVRTHWKCQSCNKLFRDADGRSEMSAEEAVVKAHHSLDSKYEKYAGCEEDGYIEHYFCTKCKKCFRDGEGAEELTSDQVRIAATGHSLEKVDAKQATATRAGNIECWKCTKCGKWFKDADGKTEVARKDTIVPPSRNHTWDSGTVTTPATCRSKGVKTFTCSDCHLTKTEEIPINPNNHTGGTEIRNRKSVTCGAAGYTGDAYCLGCSRKLASGQTIPATGNHTWDAGSVTRAATTTQEGVKTFTCTVCHATRTESIPKLNTPKPTPPPASNPTPKPTPEPTQEKQENTITASNIVRSYSTKEQTVSLGASANGAALTYKSSKPKKVKVNANGKVTITKKFSGTVKITITSAETDAYKPATKTITVTVPTITNVSKATVGKGQVVIQWKKNTTGKGYQIQYSTDKKFKKGTKTVKNKKNSIIKSTLKLKKGTWYVRIRTVNGKYGSNWGKVKTVTVK